MIYVLKQTTDEFEARQRWGSPVYDFSSSSLAEWQDNVWSIENLLLSYVVVFA